MTSATLSIPSAVTGETAPRKRGAFSRFVQAITEARMRQAEREIARVRHMLPQIEIGKID